jgi:hypothetical protein
MRAPITFRIAFVMTLAAILARIMVTKPRRRL